MKKTRISAAVALVLSGALALAACSPPNENDSEQKEYNDTATTGPAVPSIATTGTPHADGVNSVDGEATDAVGATATSTESGMAGTSAVSDPLPNRDGGVNAQLEPTVVNTP